MLSRALKSAVPSAARAFATAKAPLRVVVTGPAGAIGYAMLYRIASGEMLGKDQPIELRLLELPVRDACGLGAIRFFVLQFCDAIGNVEAATMRL